MEKQQQDKGFERRVKRSVYGTPHRARVLPGPGFLAEVYEETRTLLPQLFSPPKFEHRLSLEEHEIVLENIDYHSLLELSLSLLTPADIRLQLFQGKSGDLGSFLTALEKIPLSLYLPEGAVCRVKVDSGRSRLYHEGLLREKIEDLLRKNSYQAGSEGEFHLFFTLLRNVLTVEISLSGDPLWRRGYRADFTAAAPLREDLAQSAIQAAVRFSSEKCRNIDFDTLLLPFAGTGTFLFEALMNRWSLPLSIFGRDFSFTRFACFHEANYRWLQNTLQERAADLCSRDEALPDILAVDSSSRALGAFRENLKRFFSGVNVVCARESDAEIDSLRVLQADALAEPWQELLPGPGRRVLLPLNPPYGKRLGSTRSDTRESSYRKIGIRYREFASFLSERGSTLSGFILCPDEHSWRDFLNFASPGRQRTLHFSQGGLDIRLCLFSEGDAAEPLE